jgi:hypothetical protein
MMQKFLLVMIHGLTIGINLGIQIMTDMQDGAVIAEKTRKI